jgi:hypothetical protein
VSDHGPAGDQQEKQDKPISPDPVTILKDSCIFPSDGPDFFGDAGRMFEPAEENQFWSAARHYEMSAYDPKRTWRGHWNLRKIEHRREPPEGDMQRRGGSRQSVKEQRTTMPKTRKAPTTHVAGADLPAFIVIDDKGNDFFKD